MDPGQRSVPPAGATAEAALVARAGAGDRAARAALVSRSGRLVRHVASRYQGLGLPMDDLVQEGSIGLLHAIDTYDASRGASFATYAQWPVRCAIGRAVVQRGRFIRLPRRVAASRDGARREIAAPASLDAPIDDSGTPLGAVLADPSAPDPQDEAMRHERERLLASALDHLPARRRYVLERYFGLRGESRTLSEVADELHISRQRAQAIRNEGLNELAAELSADYPA
jgi:RNA polymerase sigma factor (sigma-70 family)